MRLYLILDGDGNRFAIIRDSDRGPTILGGTRDITELLWRDGQPVKIAQNTDEKKRRGTYIPVQRDDLGIREREDEGLVVHGLHWSLT